MFSRSVTFNEWGYCFNRQLNGPTLFVGVLGCCLVQIVPRLFQSHFCQFENIVLQAKFLNGCLHRGVRVWVCFILLTLVLSSRVFPHVLLASFCVFWRFFQLFLALISTFDTFFPHYHQYIHHYNTLINSSFKLIFEFMVNKPHLYEIIKKFC